MFYVHKSVTNWKKRGFYLVYDNWDDFDYKTNFTLYYYDGEEHYSLGYTKIAYKQFQKPGRTYDYLDGSFEQLSSDYFSLGQEVSFYLKLNDLDEKFEENIKHMVLTGLNDIAYNNNLYNENKDNEVLNTSLLRWVTPLSITGQFHRVALGGLELTDYHFIFNYQIFNKYSRLEFEVDPDSIIPTNIHAIIGRNGSGKTYLINEMIKSLSLKTKTNSSFDIQTEGTNNSNSLDNIFSKVMCISYSYFDSIYNAINPEDSIIKYEFWGIKKLTNSSNNVVYNVFSDEFSNSLIKCFKIKNKKKLWIQVLNILNIDDEISDSSISNLKYANYGTYGETATIKDRFNLLSSGHKSILSMITKIVDIIEEKTFIIIDEPESHLHPPLLSNFLKALSHILKVKNGVAFIATHSPLILREIPKSNCYIITRYGEEIKIERPKYETYGASINTIMKQAFNLESDISGFYEILNDVIEDNKQGIKEDLIHHLGDEALAYLNLLRYLKNEKDFH